MKRLKSGNALLISRHKLFSLSTSAGAKGPRKAALKPTADEEAPTGLLGLGPAGALGGLTPHGDPVLQQSQGPALLPARRTHLHHAGAGQHHAHVLVVLDPCHTHIGEKGQWMAFIRCFSYQWPLVYNVAMTFTHSYTHSHTPTTAEVSTMQGHGQLVRERLG